jgi:DNA repair exonuclease SbcCD nuclease subunit
MNNSFLYGSSEVDGVSVRLMDTYFRIKKLVDFAIAKKVDFVVHAGDVSDSSNPSEIVRRYFAEAILPLLLSGIPFIVIAGNHDLQFGRNWLTSMGLIENNNLIVIETSGVLIFETPKKEEVHISAVPYGGYDMLGAIKKFNKKNIEKEVTRGCFSMMLVHIGLKEGVVGVNEINLKAECGYKLFKKGNYDYVALGHYHKRQSFGNVHYSGSLLRSDFSERKEKKGFVYYEDGKIKFVVLPDRRFVHLTNKHFKTIVGKRTRNFKKFVLRDEFLSLIKDSIIKIRLLISSDMFRLINASDISNQLYSLGAAKVLYDWNIDLDNKRSYKEKEDFDFINYDEAIKRYCLKNGIRDKEFINQGRQIWREALQGFGE